MAERIAVEVGGRRLSLSNLDKVLYPGDAAHGFTKGEVIDYYSRVSEPLLAHIGNRPATRKRYPDGVTASSFFEKNAPSHTPDWVRRVTLPAPGSTKEREEVTYVVADDLPTLVWLANLAVLELHVPQWKITDTGDARMPDLLVLDLDPGEGADIVECCEVAMMLREALEDDGLTCIPKTSGSKGMQLYAPVDVSAAAGGAGATSAYAKSLAGGLERAHPGLVIARMTKKDRAGKIFIDWSQNNPAKTTVAAYSLRARDRPTVSTPITWDEVAACRRAADLRFVAGDVIDRIADLGDLFAATRPTESPPIPDVA